MKCRDCKYFEFVNYEDICTYKNESIRYDYEACENFLNKCSQATQQYEEFNYMIYEEKVKLLNAFLQIPIPMSYETWSQLHRLKKYYECKIGKR